MWWPRTRLATDDGQPGCSGPPPQWQIDNMGLGPPRKKKVSEDKDEGPVITLADYEDFETATESEKRVAERRHNHRNTKTIRFNKEPSQPGPSALPRIIDVPDSGVNSKRLDSDDDDLIIVSDDEESEKQTNRFVSSNVEKGKGGSGKVGISSGNRTLPQLQRATCITPDLDEPEATEPTRGGVITLADFEDADGFPLVESLRHNLRNTELNEPGPSAPAKVHDVLDDGDVEIVARSFRSHRSNANLNIKRVAADDDEVTIINASDLENGARGSRKAESSDGSRTHPRSQRAICITPDHNEPEATEPTTGGVITLADFEDADGTPLVESLRHNHRNIEATSSNTELDKPGSSAAPQVHDVLDDGDVEIVARHPGSHRSDVDHEKRRALVDNEDSGSRDRPTHQVVASNIENGEGESKQAGSSDEWRQTKEIVHQTDNFVKKVTENNTPVTSGPLNIQDVPGYEHLAEDSIKGKSKNSGTTRHNNATENPESSDPPAEVAIVDSEEVPEIERELQIQGSTRTKQATIASKKQKELIEPEVIDISDDEIYPVREIKIVEPLRSALKTANRDENTPKTDRKLKFSKFNEVYEVPYKKVDNNGNPYINLHVRDERRIRYHTKLELKNPPPKPISAKLGSPDDIDVQDVELKSSIKKAFQLIKSVSAEKPPSELPEEPEAAAQDSSESPQIDEVSDADEDSKKYNELFQSFFQKITYKLIPGVPRKIPTCSFITRRIRIPTGYNDLETAPPMKEGVRRWRILNSDDELEDLEMIESFGQPRPRRPRRRFGRRVPRVITIDDNAEQPGASAQPSEGANPSVPNTSGATNQPQGGVITLDDYELDPPSTGSGRGSRRRTQGSTARTVGGVITIEDFEIDEPPGTTSNPIVLDNTNPDRPATTEQPYQRVITMADYETGSPPPESERGVWRRAGTSARAVGGVVTIEDYEDAEQPGAPEPQASQVCESSNPPIPEATNDQSQPAEKPYERVITLDDFEIDTPSEIGQRSTRAPRVATDDGQPGTSGLPPLRSRRSKAPANSDEPKLIDLDAQLEASEQSDGTRSGEQTSDEPYKRVITLDDFEKPSPRRGQRRAPRIATDDGQPGTSGLPPLCSRRSKRPINDDEPDVIIDDDQQGKSKPYKKVITMADYEADTSVPHSEERQQHEEVVTVDDEPRPSELPPPPQKESSIEFVMEVVNLEETESSNPKTDKRQPRKSACNIVIDEAPGTSGQSPQETNGSHPSSKTNESAKNPDVITLDDSVEIERPSTWKPEWPPQLARRSKPPVLNTFQGGTEQPEVIILEDEPPTKTTDRIVEVTKRVIKLGNEYIIIIETTFRKFRERRSQRKRKTVLTLEESERGDILMGVKVTNMDYYQRELQKYENRLKTEQEEKENLNWNNYYTDTPGAKTFPYGLRHQPHQFPVEDLEKKKEEQEAKRRKKEEEQQEEKRTRGQRKNKRALAEEDKKQKRTPEYFQGVKYGKEFQLVDIPAFTPDVDPTEYYKNQEPMGEVMWRPEPPKEDYKNKKKRLTFEMIYYVYWRAIWRQFEGHIPFDYALQMLMFSKYSIPDALENIDKSLKKLHQEFKPLSEGQYRKFHNFLRVRIFNRNRLQKEVLRNYYILEVNDYFLKYKLYHKSFYNKFCRCDDRLQEPLVFTPRWCCSNCTKNIKTNILPPDQLCLICQTYTELTGETRPAKDVVFSRSDMRKIADWNIFEIGEHRAVTREEFEKLERKRDKRRWKKLELTEEEHNMLNMNLVPHKEEWKSKTLTLEQGKELGKFFVEQLTPHPIPLFVPCGCTAERGDRPWMIRKDKLPKKDDETPDTTVVKTVAPVAIPATKKKAVRGQGKGRLPPEQILTPGAWWTLKVGRSRGYARKRKA